MMGEGDYRGRGRSKRTLSDSGSLRFVREGSFVLQRRRARNRSGLKWFAAYIATALVLTVQAHSRPPIPPAQFKAVRAHWKHRADRVKAFDVMWCESGYSVWARNGQYLGLWQFGSYARARFGFGWSVWAQTAAAFRYWQVAGWSPWECA